jgi:hypothetical protein
MGHAVWMGDLLTFFFLGDKADFFWDGVRLAQRGVSNLDNSNIMGNPFILDLGFQGIF